MILQREMRKGVTKTPSLKSGEAGIRTLGTLTGTPVFKTGAIGRSATSPSGAVRIFGVFELMGQCSRVELVRSLELPKATRGRTISSRLTESMISRGRIPCWFQLRADPMSEFFRELILNLDPSRMWWEWEPSTATVWDRCYRGFNLFEGICWIVFAVLVLRAGCKIDAPGGNGSMQLGLSPSGLQIFARPGLSRRGWCWSKVSSSWG